MLVPLIERLYAVFERQKVGKLHHKGFPLLLVTKVGKFLLKWDFTLVLKVLGQRAIDLTEELRHILDSFHLEDNDSSIEHPSLFGIVQSIPGDDTFTNAF